MGYLDFSIRSSAAVFNVHIQRNTNRLLCHTTTEHALNRTVALMLMVNGLVPRSPSCVISVLSSRFASKTAAFFPFARRSC